MSEISDPAAASPPLTLRYRLTVDDIAASMNLRSGTLRWLAVIAAAAVLAIAGLGWLVSGDSATLLVGVVAAPVILVVLSSAWFRRRVVRSAIRRQSVEALAFAEYTLSVAPEGLHVQQGASTALIGWPEVTGIRENSEVLLVLTGKLPRLTVPKHAFPNAAVLAEFRAAIAQWGGRIAG